MDRSKNRHFGFRALAGLLCLTVTFGPHSVLAADRSGEQIYQQQCAACHGTAGVGTKDHYGKPLVGNLPVAELASFIIETMPEEDPEACVGEDAEKVAGYIYEAFYSEAAQARNSRPRIELSRLTVRQYQNTVADLVGSFSAAGRLDDERGLQGDYFNGRRTRNNRGVLERRDPTINFNFGNASPQPGKIGTDEFSIRWQGGVIAPDTGQYEFIIKTENGARLWVNDTDRPLIDAGIKSGSDTEYRQSIRLLGGRVYPLRLEFYKSKEPSASIALWWKTPQQVAQLIPQRNLSPNRAPQVFVLETPFPPDDRSIGYERGTSISKGWDQATTYSAIEVAGYVAAEWQELAGYRSGGPDLQRRLREFCHQFAERAFRRPLSDEEKQFFVDRQLAAHGDPQLAVKKVVLLVLKSPRFLYREIGRHGDAYDVAARISFGLWDSLPDQQLIDAAAQNQLKTAEQVSRQAERMLGDLRTKAKLREFLHQWLQVDRVEDVSKDGAQFPEFDESITSDLRTSLDLFLDDVIWNDASDFRQLLLSNDLYLNGSLSPIYGANLPADAPFQKVSLDPVERAGVLSHPFLLTGFAYHATSSPIHRGVFIARSLLGRSLRPPPEAVSPLAPDLHPDLTTRERVILQTNPTSCQSCHGMINPLGFSLEHYDAIGRFRDVERDRPIDAAGYYQTLDGRRVEFNGVRDMAEFLAGSEETHAAFVEQLFHYMVKQPIRAYGSDQPDSLRQSLVASDFNVKRLLMDIITTSALTPEEK